MTMDARARLILGRRIQRVYEDWIPGDLMRAVRFREAILGLVEDAELAGAFASEVVAHEAGS